MPQGVRVRFPSSPPYSILKDSILNLQTERTELHQALITVELDFAQLEQKKQQAAKILARTTRIPGFRPGKAPYHMILRHIGEGRILEEAVEKLIDEIYPKVLEESGVKPYGAGKLEALKLEDTPPTAQFIIPLAPEVTLGEFQNVRLPYELAPVNDENVAKAIEGMREMYAEVAKVDRPAEEADLVNMVLTGKFADSEEEKLYIDHESYPVIIEPETAEAKQEWPFLGFSRHLIGLSAEEKKSLTHTYPEDYEDEETEESSISLKGKTVVFEIEVTKVSSRSIPEVNEEFIKKMGPYETVEEFYADTRKQLIERNDAEYNEIYEERLLEEVLKDSEVKYPQDAVDDEVDLLFNRLKNRLENQGIGFDIYLKARSTTEEQIREELRPSSEKRLKETLLLMEIAEKANIQVNQDEVQHEIEHALGHLLSGMSEQEARRTFNNDALRGLTANVYNNTLLATTLKHLRALASGELERLALEEAISETNSTEDANETELPAITETASGETIEAVTSDLEVVETPQAVESDTPETAE